MGIITTALNQRISRDDIPPDWGCLTKECSTCKGIRDCDIFARAAEAYL